MNVPRRTRMVLKIFSKLLFVMAELNFSLDFFLRMSLKNPWHTESKPNHTQNCTAAPCSNNYSTHTHNHIMIFRVELAKNWSPRDNKTKACAHTHTPYSQTPNVLSNNSSHNCWNLTVLLLINRSTFLYLLHHSTNTHSPRVALSHCGLFHNSSWPEYPWVRLFWFHFYIKAVSEQIINTGVNVSVISV